MSIFMKILILVILFILLNIVSIYTFNYADYFSSKKDKIQLDENKGIFNFFSEEFFKKVEYKPSNFIISKDDDQLYLSGTFSSQEIANQMLTLLKINHLKDINFEKNTQINKDLLFQIEKIIESLKDLFKNGSKLTVNENKLTLEGSLKSNDYKDLLNVIISEVTGFEIKTIIHEEEVKIIDQNQENVTNNENIYKNEDNASKKLVVLSKDDIQLQVDNIFIKDKIAFERRSTEPTTKSKELIEKVANVLNQNSSFTVEIAGHTDSRGNKELNKKISQDRANRVKEILESFGVDKNRVTSVGYGNEKPIAQDDENGLSDINRRVEFTIGG